MAESKYALEVENLAKTYVTGFFRKKVVALRGISFQIEPGECVGLIGPNGAGKTTTIKIATGLVRPGGGTVRVLGESVGNRRAMRRVGYLPENPYFYEHLNPTELLIFYGQLFGLARKTLSKRVPELLERVGLAHAARRPLKKFSKGMRQRAGIAQALVNDPDFVILDEPQSGLDPIGRRQVRDLINELHEEGKTILLSSHILPDVEAVCDRVIVLREGRVKKEMDLATLSEHPKAFDVVLRGANAAAAFEGVSSVVQRGEYTQLRFESQKAMDEVLQEALATGAEIHSISPHGSDLEDLLLDDRRQP
jgi:ABC-2 type transport system ATP-binding protein